LLCVNYASAGTVEPRSFDGHVLSYLVWRRVDKLSSQRQMYDVVTAYVLASSLLQADSSVVHRKIYGSDDRKDTRRRLLKVLSIAIF